MCWFFYLISCHGHICHHFCLQDDDDDKHAKEMHPDRVTQTSTWMLIVIVLTHKCKFLTADCSRHNLIATYVSCKIQDKSFFFLFFFVRSCHHKPSGLQLNVFTLRKECNNVIFSRLLDRFGYMSLFPINCSKALFFFFLWAVLCFQTGNVTCCWGVFSQCTNQRKITPLNTLKKTSLRPPAS